MSARVGLADLAISPKDEVALAGTADCGKSMLVKTDAGLYKPSYGNVYIDGQPLSRWNAQSLRSQIALVAQDDSLLQGPLASHADGRREASRPDAPHSLCHTTLTNTLRCRAGK